MQKFDNMDFYDFEFNGHKLSEFNGYVGSSDGGFKLYSVLPSRSYVTEKPLNTDVTMMFTSSLEPRVFDIPVVFEQFHDGDLRVIAKWLNSPTPSKFQWVGDTIYINACLDSQDFNTQSSSGQDGQLVLKFICFDPYYYDNNITQHTQTSLVSGQLYSYVNNGVGELEPYMTISCNGTIKIEVLDSEGKVFTTTNITNITGGVKIDSNKLECTLLSGASHFAYIDSFPMLPEGNFSIKITGSNLTNMIIEYRQKYL